MSWVVAGLAGAGALKGHLDAQSNQDKTAEHNKYRKAVLANSPWTGMQDPGMANFGNTNNFSGMLGGGLQGAMIGTAFAPAAAPATAAASAKGTAMAGSAAPMGAFGNYA